MTSSVLLTVAAGGEHPLIDIDSTAFLQFGIFVLTALVASRLLFRPYLAMRDRRSAGIDGARADATRMSAEADGKLTAYEAELAAARSRANDERRAIRTEAAEHQRQVTDKARSESIAALEQAKAKVTSETEAARSQLMPRASQLADEIAAKLLGRKVG
jgi:F-type H+-transporting ATPase subunit b